MQLIKSPNRWSCFPTSLAMVLGISVDTIVLELGHDGSEIINPDLPEPMCRKGFCLPEMFDVAFRRGFILAIVDAVPYSALDEEHIYELYDEQTSFHRFLAYIRDRAGILTGSLNGVPHAVAWDGQQIYCPTGFIYPFERMQVEAFYLAAKWDASYGGSCKERPAQLSQV